MTKITTTQKISRTTISAIVASTVALSGCEMTDENLTKAQGAVVGVASGIALGLILGDSKKAAILGAAIGLIAGHIYAQHVANKKESYANNETYMTDVIAQADEMIAGSQLQRKTLEANIAKYNKQSEELIKLQQDEKANSEELAKHQQAIKKDLEDTEKFLVALDTEIKIQSETLETERPTLAIKLVSLSESKIKLLRDEQNKQDLLKKQLASFDRKRIY